MKEEFYSKGCEVFKKPGKLQDGTPTTIGFRLLRIDDHMSNREDIAAFIAYLLNEYYGKEFKHYNLSQPTTRYI